MYPSEFNIYATVSKVEMHKEDSKRGGILHLFVLDGQKGAASTKRVSHQGHLLREMTGSKWIEVQVDDVSKLKKITSGDLISLGVLAENNSQRTLRASPSRLGLPIYDKKLNNLVTFVHDVIGNKFSGDKEVKKLFGIFGDELFDYALNKTGDFLSKGKHYGASIASLIRCREKAESYVLANEAFDVLRKASVEMKSAARIVNEYGGNTYNHLEENPWYFCRYPRLLIQYRDETNKNSASGAQSAKPKRQPSESKLSMKVRALDDIYKILNGTSEDLDSHIGRAYWIYSSLVHKGHNDGHTAVTRDDLIKDAYESGLYEFEQAEQILDKIVKYGSFVESEDANGVTLISDKHDFDTEKLIVDIIKEKMTSQEKMLDEDKLLFEDFFTQEQRQAVKDSIKHKLCVITGGAGTGKTTVIKSIIKNFMSHDSVTVNDIVLLAPTGKAKDRMKESTGYDANTIHKLITKHRFAGNSKCKGKVFIVDEAGMLDSKLMLDFLSIVPDDAHIVFVGDYKQLAPVNHGQPFKDMLVTKFVASTKLSKPQRTSGESEIHQAAMLVSEGMLPEFSRYQNEVTYFSADKDDVILDEIVRTLTDDFEDKFKTTLDDTVILAPMNIGDVGVRNLNKQLKRLMNPNAQGEGVKFGGKGPFHEGDRIIVNRNDNKNDISNGDVGVIKAIGERGELSLSLRGKTVTLWGKQRNIVDHAFCLTVHKTQGSEYETVIMAMSKSHKRMLTPELFYTGITRAKQNFILIGNADAVSHACDNENRQVRTTYMEAKLKNMAIENGVKFEEDVGVTKQVFDADDFGFSSRTNSSKQRGGDSDNTVETHQTPVIGVIPIEAYSEYDIPPEANDDYQPYDNFGVSGLDSAQHANQTQEHISHQQRGGVIRENMPPQEVEQEKDISIDMSGLKTDGSSQKPKSSKDTVMDFDDFQF